jgi:hypothetical protein
MRILLAAVGLLVLAAVSVIVLGMMLYAVAIILGAIWAVLGYIAGV